MKQYKIVKLDDVEISDNSDETIKEKLEMERSLKEYNEDPDDYSVFEQETSDCLDVVLANCLTDRTDGCADEDYMNGGYLPVAAYCDGKFRGFFLLYQEVTINNLNIDL